MNGIIIYYGIQRKEDETRQDCEELVCEMIADKLELAETIQFDRVHRLNAKPNSPIVARCIFYKDKKKHSEGEKEVEGQKGLYW